MHEGVNRGGVAVLPGGFGSDAPAADTADADGGDRAVKSGNADDAAFIVKDTSKVVAVSGSGTATVHLRYAAREMAHFLKEEGGR